MPTVAQSALMRRLYDSGELERMQTDFVLLTGRRLEWLPEGVDPAGRQVVASLRIGASDLGVLACDGFGDPARDGALRRVLAMMAESLAQHSIEPTRRRVIPAQAEAAAKILRQRFQDPLRLTDVAAELGVSRERLSRLFHAALGVTFSEYLNLVRLECARRLLQDPRVRVADLAFESGFQSISQFNRRFKASEGMSPSEYRKRRLENKRSVNR